MRVRPAFGHQPAVPGQQGAGSYAEGYPRRTGEHATEAGQQGTIGGLVGALPHLAPKYFHFVAQGEEFDDLGPVASEEQEDQFEQLTDSEVDEGPQLATEPVPSHRVDGSRDDPHLAESLMKHVIAYSDATSDLLLRCFELGALGRRDPLLD